VPNLSQTDLGNQTCRINRDSRAKSLEIPNPKTLFWIFLSAFCLLSSFVLCPLSFVLCPRSLTRVCVFTQETRQRNANHSGNTYGFKRKDCFTMENSVAKRTSEDSMDTSKKRCRESESNVKEDSNHTAVHVSIQKSKMI
jgi:hypothetical protein